jgi:hemerythrin-like domain-containing protein
VRRSVELAPLSRDHHVALTHSLRLRRATGADVDAVTARFLAFFVEAGRAHFTAEEEVLLPHVPSAHSQLAQRLLDEHAEIRAAASAVGLQPTVEEAHRLGALLGAHVRFEERTLFPVLEASLPPERLREVGRALSRA